MSSAPARPDSGRTHEVPRLHLVTDDCVLLRSDFTARASEVLRAVGDRVALHVRGPGLEGAAIHGVARELSRISSDSGSCLVVNDRVDVALAVGADGVHLGQRSLPPGIARDLVGPGSWVGVSAHAVSEACRAADEGADYLFVGTLFSTPSHGEGQGGGPELVEAVRAVGVTVPLIGIGGVTPGRVGPVCAAGADGVAVIRGVWDAADPVEAVKRYLEALEEHGR